MNARDDLADAGLYASLLTEISDVLACLPDNDAGVLCANESAEGESVVGRRRRRAGLCWGGCAAESEKKGKRSGKKRDTIFVSGGVGGHDEGQGGRQGEKKEKKKKWQGRKREAINLAAQVDQTRFSLGLARNLMRDSISSYRNGMSYGRSCCT